MMHRIRADLDDAPDPGPWLEAARTLCDQGTISENMFIYFAEIFTECVVAHGAVEDPELVRLRAAMDEIEDAHGLADDEFWYVDEAPADWRALNDEWEGRADALVAAKLRTLGFGDLAELRQSDIDEWDDRGNCGRVELWGEDPE